MLRIAFDVDGVLADFRTAFHIAAERCLGRSIPDTGDPKAAQALEHRDVKRVWEYVAKTPNWWMTLSAYEPAQVARLYRRRGPWVGGLLRDQSAGERRHTVQFQTQSWIEQPDSICRRC